jgi:hypothetical protein
MRTIRHRSLDVHKESSTNQCLFLSHSLGYPFITFPHPKLDAIQSKAAKLKYRHCCTKYRAGLREKLLCCWQEGCCWTSACRASSAMKTWSLKRRTQIRLPMKRNCILAWCGNMSSNQQCQSTREPSGWPKRKQLTEVCNIEKEVHPSISGNQHCARSNWVRVVTTFPTH